MKTDNMFLEKFRADVNEAILLKRKLNEHTDGIRYSASQHLHVLQKQVQKAFEDDQESARSFEYEVEHASKQIRAQLERIANL